MTLISTTMEWRLSMLGSLDNFVVTFDGLDMRDNRWGEACVTELVSCVLTSDSFG